MTDIDDLVGRLRDEAREIVHAWLRSETTPLTIKMTATPEAVDPLVDAIASALCATKRPTPLSQKEGPASSEIEAQGHLERLKQEQKQTLPNLEERLKQERDAAEARIRELEARLAMGIAACNAFDGPPSESEWCNGQATAAEQIRARLTGGSNV